MADWRHLEGEALNRCIAERLGYRAINLNDAPDGIRPRTRYIWIAVPPRMVGDWAAIREAWDGEGNALTEEDAWHNFLLNEQWESTCDAALTLPLENGHAFLLGVDPAAMWRNACTIQFDGNSGLASDAARGKRPALCVCYAWLDYCDWLNKTGDWAE